MNKKITQNAEQIGELLRNDSELVVESRIKVVVTPKTVSGLLGYYLDTLGVDHEKAGNGYYIREEEGSGAYEMFFRVDEKSRKITLTHDLELPIPEDKERDVSRLLAKINNVLYNEEFRLEVYNGHVRLKTFHTVKTDITDDSMPGDVMRCFTLPAMIDSIVESFQTVYPALMAVLYEGENADDAIDIMMDELHPLSWAFLYANRR